MKTAITGAIEEVRYNGGHSTRKPSTVTMTVSHKFAIEVADLMEDYIKAGIEPEQGLLRLELIAVYADPPEAEENPYATVPSDFDGSKPDGYGESLDESEQAGEIITDLTDTVDEALESTDMEDTDG